MSLGFVFPGQGSQAVGMLAELAVEHPSVVERFNEAGDVLSMPLWEIVSEDPRDQLGQTEITQPALLTASVSLWEVWQQSGGPTPAVMAGHSLGEYSALVCSGSLSFEAAVQLVHQRGRFMQAAVPKGTGLMAAILGLDDAVIAEHCAAVDGVVSPANLNAPGQVVIAGAAGAVEEAVTRLKDAGAKRAVTLDVSVPSHCALMRPAAEQLAGLLDEADVSIPAIPVIHNVDAAVSDSSDAIKDRLVRQLYEPVQWTACVRGMAERGAQRLVECGPGKVLAGLSKRIDKSIAMDNVSAPKGLADALASAAEGGP